MIMRGFSTMLLLFFSFYHLLSQHLSYGAYQKEWDGVQDVYMSGTDVGISQHISIIPVMSIDLEKTSYSTEYLLDQLQTLENKLIVKPLNKVTHTGMSKTGKKTLMIRTKDIKDTLKKLKRPPLETLIGVMSATSSSQRAHRSQNAVPERTEQLPIPLSLECVSRYAKMLGHHMTNDLCDETKYSLMVNQTCSGESTNCVCRRETEGWGKPLICVVEKNHTTYEVPEYHVVKEEIPDAVPPMILTDFCLTIKDQRFGFYVRPTSSNLFQSCNGGWSFCCLKQKSETNVRLGEYACFTGEHYVTLTYNWHHTGFNHVNRTKFEAWANGFLQAVREDTVVAILQVNNASKCELNQECIFSDKICYNKDFSLNVTRISSTDINLLIYDNKNIPYVNIKDKKMVSFDNQTLSQNTTSERRKRRSPAVCSWPLLGSIYTLFVGPSKCSQNSDLKAMRNQITKIERGMLDLQDTLHSEVSKMGDQIHQVNYKVINLQKTVSQNAKMFRKAILENTKSVTELRHDTYNALQTLHNEVRENAFWTHNEIETLYRMSEYQTGKIFSEIEKVKAKALINELAIATNTLIHKKKEQTEVIEETVAVAFKSMYRGKTASISLMVSYYAIGGNLTTLGQRIDCAYAEFNLHGSTHKPTDMCIRTTSGKIKFCSNYEKTRLGYRALTELTDEPSDYSQFKAQYASVIPEGIRPNEPLNWFGTELAPGFVTKVKCSDSKEIGLSIPCYNETKETLQIVKAMTQKEMEMKNYFTTYTKHPLPEGAHFQLGFRYDNKVHESIIRASLDKVKDNIERMTLQNAKADVQISADDLSISKSEFLWKKKHLEVKDAIDKLQKMKLEDSKVGWVTWLAIGLSSLSFGFSSITCCCICLLSKRAMAAGISLEDFTNQTTNIIISTKCIPEILYSNTASFICTGKLSGNFSDITIILTIVCAPLTLIVILMIIYRNSFNNYLQFWSAFFGTQYVTLHYCNARTMKVVPVCDPIYLPTCDLEKSITNISGIVTMLGTLFGMLFWWAKGRSWKMMSKNAATNGHNIERSIIERAMTDLKTKLLTSESTRGDMEISQYLRAPVVLLACLCCIPMTAASVGIEESNEESAFPIVCLSFVGLNMIIVLLDGLVKRGTLEGWRMIRNRITDEDEKPEELAGADKDNVYEIKAELGTWNSCLTFFDGRSHTTSLGKTVYREVGCFFNTGRYVPVKCGNGQLNFADTYNHYRSSLILYADVCFFMLAAVCCRGESTQSGFNFVAIFGTIMFLKCCSSLRKLLQEVVSYRMLDEAENGIITKNFKQLVGRQDGVTFSDVQTKLNFMSKCDRNKVKKSISMTKQGGNSWLKLVLLLLVFVCVADAQIGPYPKSTVKANTIGKIIKEEVMTLNKVYNEVFYVKHALHGCIGAMALIILISFGLLYHLYKQHANSTNSLMSLGQMITGKRVYNATDNGAQHMIDDRSVFLYVKTDKEVKKIFVGLVQCLSGGTVRQSINSLQQATLSVGACWSFTILPVDRIDFMKSVKNLVITPKGTLNISPEILPTDQKILGAKIGTTDEVVKNVDVATYFERSQQQPNRSSRYWGKSKPNVPLRSVEEGRSNGFDPDDVEM